jgi:nucleotide-binding universal stress UspA family protein
MPRTLLVALDDGAQSDELLRLACDLAGVEGRIIALAVSRVHPSLPLSDLPEVVDQRARYALQRAQDVARDYGYEIETRLRRGRDVATVIVLEAACVEAEAILLALAPPRFSWLAPRLSRTARDVLRRAPCPVLLEHDPDGDPLRASEAVAEAERVLGHAS